MSLRSIAPIVEGKPLRRNPVAPPPKIAWLRLDQLVIDESYQRGLSHKSMALIRRLVERWDWNCFKPLSVALIAGGGQYEIIDGQHTALAAATHGSIETLPCLVLDVATVAERSAAFVGINRDRVSLTPYSLYRARVAAGDPEAVAVHEGLNAAGATLLEALRFDVDYGPGVIACIGALLLIARRGGKARVARLLKICMAADVTPIPSAVLKGLDEVVRAPEPPSDADLIVTLSRLGGETLIDRAADRRRNGLAPDQATAVMQVLLRELSHGAAA